MGELKVHSTPGAEDTRASGLERWALFRNNLNVQEWGLVPQRMRLSQVKLPNTRDVRNRAWHAFKCRKETATLLTSGVLLPLQNVISMIHRHEKQPPPPAPQTQNPPRPFQRLSDRAVLGFRMVFLLPTAGPLSCPTQIYTFYFFIFNV